MGSWKRTFERSATTVCFLTYIYNKIKGFALQIIDIHGSKIAFISSQGLCCLEDGSAVGLIPIVFHAKFLEKVSREALGGALFDLHLE